MSEIEPVENKGCKQVNYTMIVLYADHVANGCTFSHGKRLVNMLKHSPADTEVIEKAKKKKKHGCKRWHEERYGRITSSAFGDIVKCRQYEEHACPEETLSFPEQTVNICEKGLMKKLLDRSMRDKTYITEFLIVVFIFQSVDF